MEAGLSEVKSELQSRDDLLRIIETERLQLHRELLKAGENQNTQENKKRYCLYMWESEKNCSKNDTWIINSSAFQRLESKSILNYHAIYYWQILNIKCNQCYFIYRIYLVLTYRYFCTNECKICFLHSSKNNAIDLISYYIYIQSNAISLIFFKCLRF